MVFFLYLFENLEKDFVYKSKKNYVMVSKRRMREIYILWINDFKINVYYFKFWNKVCLKKIYYIYDLGKLGLYDKVEWFCL